VPFPLLAVARSARVAGAHVALSRRVRGVQWWNSSAWVSGDPDALFWTDRRALRRARLVRAAAFAFILAVGAAGGALAALAIWVR
jgi:hypothetical protein